MDEQPPSYYQTFLIAAIIIILLLLGAIFIYLYSAKQQLVPEVTAPGPETPSPTQQETQSETPPVAEIPTPTAGVVPDVIANPVEELPSANPFETQTNPFEDAYKNPFE